MSTSASRSYIICTAPRTGSTLLAQALDNSGRAGHPNEYFDIYPHNERYWIDKLGIQDDASYLDKAIAAGTTANGVFGLKLLWHQSPALFAKLKAARPAEVGEAKGLSHPLLSATLGMPPSYIWLRRRDKLAQAISYYRASRTGLWRSTDQRPSGDVPRREPPFDFEAIAQYLRAVNEFDARWQQFFRRDRLKVLMIVYENFIGAYEATLLSVLEFLGLPTEGVIVPAPQLARQADDRSVEWQQRFLEMAQKQQGIKAHQAVGAPPSLPAPEASPKPEKRPRKARPAAAAASGPTLPLLAYALVPDPPPLLKARPERDWMEASSVRFAYRCLPMVIANQSGWVILNRQKFVATWTGGPDPGALKIEYLGGEGKGNAISLFGGGVLTFTIGYLFRTPPGYNLHVRGPANTPRDGIAALEGIVESDWTEATFTMNWKITRTNHPLVFEEGDAIAMLSPIARGEVERFRPELRSLAEAPELAALHREWAHSRQQHNADLKDPNSKARKEGWQRHYFRGTSIDQQPAREHQTKLSLGDFVDVRSKLP